MKEYLIKCIKKNAKLIFKILFFKFLNFLIVLLGIEFV